MPEQDGKSHRSDLGTGVPHADDCELEAPEIAETLGRPKRISAGMGVERLEMIPDAKEYASVRNIQLAMRDKKKQN